MFTTYVRMFSDIINRKVLPATCLHSYFKFLTSSFVLRNWKKRNPFHILPLIVASIAFTHAPCASFNHRIHIYFVFDGAVFVGYHAISPSCHRKKKHAYKNMKNDYWLTYVPYQGKSRTGISLSNICTIDNIYHSLLTFSLRYWTQAGTVIKQQHDLLLLNYAKMKGCIMS